MSHLTYILNYLQGSTSTTYDISREDSDVVPKDSLTGYILLFLIFITAMVFFHIYDCRELRRRDQRLSALEYDMMDISGRLFPKTERPSLDEDDDFMLPPPAYEFDDGFLED